jgi:hypothetical protein
MPAAAPPRLLSHWHAAAPPDRSGLEPVGTFHDRPNGRDIDYVVPRTAAGDLIALSEPGRCPLVAIDPRD